MKIKSPNHLTVVFAFLISLAGFNCHAQSAQPTSQEPILTGMRAMLFYETNGKFSDDVFTGKVNLWNTVIEGASREGASDSMLVVVEVSGDMDALPQGRQVELMARYRLEDASGRGKPAFFRKAMRINLGTEKKYFAAFWLYQTGCHPVNLTARIIGQKQRLQKTINLRCGE